MSRTTSSSSRWSNPTSAQSDKSTHGTAVSFVSYDDEDWQPPNQKEKGLLLRSPASRRYPSECTDYGRFSTLTGNKSVKVRSAHLQWLRENGVYSMGSVDRWRTDMREYRPSSSARYPIKISFPKMLRDPEWLPEDFKVHIYHGKSERAFVKDWLCGILEVRRFTVTSGPLSTPCSTKIKRIIVILTDKVLKKGFNSACFKNAWDKLVLVIKRDHVSIPDEIEKICTAHLDLSIKCMHDYTVHSSLMRTIFKALDLPTSVCSA